MICSRFTAMLLQKIRRISLKVCFFLSKTVLKFHRRFSQTQKKKIYNRNSCQAKIWKRYIFSAKMIFGFSSLIKMILLRRICKHLNPKTFFLRLSLSFLWICSEDKYLDVRILLSIFIQSRHILRTSHLKLIKY